MGEIDLKELEKLIKTAVDGVIVEKMKGIRKGEFITKLGPEQLAAKALITTPSTDAKVITLQEKSDDLYITGLLLKTDPRNLKMYPDFQKALDTQTAGEGLEWVPTILSAELIRMIELAYRIPALHRDIPMPSDPYVIPAQVGKQIAYKIEEQVEPTGQTKIPLSKFVTGKVTMTGAGVGTRTLVSHYLEEDSIVPVLPLIKEGIADSANEAMEQAIINGDTTATHQDSDVTSADDRRKLWKGYRKLALENNWKEDLSTFDYTNIGKLQKKMGKYGTFINDLVFIGGISVWNQMKSLEEVITVDKYGPRATILTGELGKLDGIPIITSGVVREDLNASGVYDGTTKTQTVMFLVFKRGFVTGTRRTLRMRLLQELYAESEQDCLLGTMRRAFTPIYAIATEPIVAIGYNITS